MYGPKVFGSLADTEIFSVMVINPARFNSSLCCPVGTSIQPELEPWALVVPKRVLSIYISDAGELVMEIDDLVGAATGRSFGGDLTTFGVRTGIDSWLVGSTSSVGVTIGSETGHAILTSFVGGGTILLVFFCAMATDLDLCEDTGSCAGIFLEMGAIENFLDVLLVGLSPPGCDESLVVLTRGGTTVVAIVSSPLGSDF